MSKATSPNSKSPQESRISVETLSATLILESPPENIAGGDWVARELPVWLAPEKTNLHFVRAISPFSDSSWFNKQPEQYLEILNKQRDEVASCNRKILDQLKGEGFNLVRVDSDLISDQVSRRLLEGLKGTHEDLLVVASTEEKSAKANEPSSFAVRLATHAPCSVLMLRKPLPNPTGLIHVLFATDGTEASTQVLRKLPDLLKTDQFEVTVVTVQNPDVLENAIFAPYVNTAAVDEALRENADMILAIARDILNGWDIRVRETRRILGSPAWELTHLMDEMNPDLTVVGSHNRTGIGAWLLGSVSSRVVQQENHSVLVVR